MRPNEISFSNDPHGLQVWIIGASALFNPERSVHAPMWVSHPRMRQFSPLLQHPKLIAFSLVTSNIFTIFTAELSKESSSFRPDCFRRRFSNWAGLVWISAPSDRIKGQANARVFTRSLLIANSLRSSSPKAYRASRQSRRDGRSQSASQLATIRKKLLCVADGTLASKRIRPSGKSLRV